MMFAVAILEGSGLEDGLEPEIARAQQRLAVARMQESGAIAAAGGYVVDPERAQGCIDELSRILDQVRRPLMLAKQLVFDPPGTDQVSTNVARNGAIMAGRAEAYIGPGQTRSRAHVMRCSASLTPIVRLTMASWAGGCEHPSTLYCTPVQPRRARRLCHSAGAGGWNGAGFLGNTCRTSNLEACRQSCDPSVSGC
jgi:hypothetical protein